MRHGKMIGLMLSVVMVVGLWAAPWTLAEEQPRRGGVLRVAHAADPPSLDTHQEQTFAVNIPMAPVYNTLVRFDPHHYPKVIGDLAKAWSASEDALTYEFVLRNGITFHNGEPVTAEDVKFSFERYRGNSASLIKDRVAAIDMPDPRHVRFKLKQPWPDFITFYATASGAAWIVPKKYVEKVGEDGFKKAPIGAGPYKFVSFNPGVELVMEANEKYWRKTPAVKRLVFKVIPDEATRLAALKRGEVDIVYSIRGELAEEVQRSPGLTLKPVYPPAPFWLYFPDQWDPQSPWHDVRVRRAAKSGDRPQDHQRGTNPRLFQAHRQSDPGQFRILLGSASPGLRPGGGEEAAGGIGPPQRVQCGRIYL